MARKPVNPFQKLRDMGIDISKGYTQHKCLIHGEYLIREDIVDKECPYCKAHAKKGDTHG